MTGANKRIRDLGYNPGQKWLEPGPLNSITDVPGVCVGVKTLISGSSSAKTQESIVRTGVTAILPRPDTSIFSNPVFAYITQLNGTGEMTSSHMISETGTLHSPIVIGGTPSLGTMMEGVAKWAAKAPKEDEQGRPHPPFVLPCVTETSDTLSDPKAFALKVDDVLETFAQSVEKQIPLTFEGSLGGGTGMCCQGFKGGNGTSSRQLPGQGDDEKYTLGAFVQANFGTARDFIVNGLPIGKALIANGFHGESKRKAEEDHNNSEPWDSSKDGSIIVILATDAPLLPHQLARLTRRVPMGLARVGAIAHNMSGDIFLAFSTQSTVPPHPPTSKDLMKVGPLGLPAVGVQSAKMVTESSLNTFFYAVADCVEEAVLNALCAAKDMEGTNGTFAKGMPHDQVREMLSEAKDALKDVFPGLY